MAFFLASHFRPVVVRRFYFLSFLSFDVFWYWDVLSRCVFGKGTLSLPLPSPSKNVQGACMVKSVLLVPPKGHPLFFMETCGVGFDEVEKCRVVRHLLMFLKKAR